ncbi:MAG: UDP-N-acetylglucosamine 2-epimerase (non-hydrolyzing) [candidate division Zixibacteria bacterium]|nr:UDP-N-acetylglucosamine 2-epimerase (non-hydrolyzing) [candidate division Zixibacteria bacterium]
MKKVALVVGARPNFMKAAPLMRELLRHKNTLQPWLIHTGQHYDRALSQLFFEELGIPEPDLYLGVGSGTHAEQTARIMMEIEGPLQAQAPDLVVVFGDINSTMAAAIVAKKLNLKLAHVEAGLRSFDETMPEEINRIVTDRLADYLFVSEQSGLDHLAAEGVPAKKIYFTGNIMIDSLVSNLTLARNNDILDRLELTSGEYIAMTMHRPSNVDDRESLRDLMRCIGDISKRLPIVFPCHPRTRKRFEEFGLTDGGSGNRVMLIDPVGYLEFLKLQSEARLVLTDSGGIQEETTYLGIPCVTMRENTERPATVDLGTNVICGTDPAAITAAVDSVFAGKGKKGRIPDLWDGHTAERIVAILHEVL